MLRSVTYRAIRRSGFRLQSTGSPQTDRIFSAAELEPAPESGSFDAPRHSRLRRMNTVVNMVPEREAWVIERFGQFSRVLQPGLNFLLPVVDRVAYVQSLKVQAVQIARQTAITKDNVSLLVDGVLYFSITDAVKASYAVEDPLFAITNLAMSTMRTELGKLPLDRTFEEREMLNRAIVTTINEAVRAWGLDCLRYEIRDIRPPPQAMAAMELQMVAERRKREAIIESEGKRDAAINIADGQARAAIIRADAEKEVAILEAKGKAESTRLKAAATADAVGTVGSVLHAEGGREAMAVRVAEEYLRAFGELGMGKGTVIVPTNVSDVAGMVGQAMTVYDKIGRKREE